MAKKTTQKKKNAVKATAKKAPKKIQPFKNKPKNFTASKKSKTPLKPVTKKTINKKVVKLKPAKKTLNKKVIVKKVTLKSKKAIIKPTPKSLLYGKTGKTASKKLKTPLKPVTKRTVNKKVIKPKPAKKTLNKKVIVKKVTLKSKKATIKATIKPTPKSLPYSKTGKTAKKKILVKAKSKVQPKKLPKQGNQGSKVQPVKKNIKPAAKKLVQKIIPKSAKKAVKAKLFPEKIYLKPLLDNVIQAGKLNKLSVKAITRKEQSKVQTVFKKPIQITSSAVLTANKLEQGKTIQKQKKASIKTFQNFETNYNRADMFYKNVLKAEIVKRYSYDNEEGKKFLNKDISLTIKLNDKETTISEKLRDQDWNDIYVELFRKYPHEDGWIKATEAEYLGYFFPGRVFWAKMEPIEALCQDIISKAIGSGIYKELLYMYPKNSGRLSKTFKINTKTYSFNFIQTYHEDGDNSYYSIGISLPFVLLMDFRIYYKIYKQ